ncbi:MAG: hypothetical protein JOZ17_27460, partial [Acetobacteraceae bacterium]|nr:hypothetical protein [Acetobacteraceae bacterium]
MTSARSIWLDQVRNLVTASSLHAASIRIATLVLLIAACLFVPHFTQFANLQALCYAIAPVGIGAVGMALVTLNGNLFMLSMGATAAVSTVVFASVLHIGLFFSLVVVTGVGIAIGLIQGVLIASAGANPIITTIAASSIITGAGVLWTGGLTIVGEGNASWLGSGQLIGWVPNQILVLAVFALISGFVLERARIGRELRLTGMQR